MGDVGDELHDHGVGRHISFGKTWFSISMQGNGLCML